MRFGVLGPLQVQDTDDEDVALPGAGPRAVLATLLVQANQAVPVDRIVEAVWRGQPPRSWVSNVQTYISRLRHALPGLDIRYAERSYRLCIDAAALDLTEFWTDVDAGRKYLAEGEYTRAVVRFRAALGRWRGAPLAGLNLPVLEPELHRLEEERLTVLEECLDAELTAARHADVIGELRALVAAHPGRDRLVGQLMLALARSGRTTDGLAAYREARVRAGGESGPELRRLHAAVHRGEVTVPRPLLPRTRFPVCLLPPDVPNLTGRGALVADLLAHLGSAGTAVPLVALDGAPGVGKSALAVHLAHRARAGYPDGQLYSDLAGASGNPREPLDVLAEWLHALGVTGSAVPAGLAARAAAFRARLADRRVLVVLDDAADAAQVQPLLPGTPGSAAVVTSRSRLTGLPTTATRMLTPLRGAESRALLAASFGQARVAAERAAADLIATSCGHLPLALRIAAAGHDQQLAPLAERLSALAEPDAPVHAGVALRHAALDRPARLALSRLALLGPVDAPDWVIATLIDVQDAAAVTGPLVDAHLLEATGRDAAGQPRFRVHELVRGYATGHADDDEDPAELLARLNRRATALVDLATAALPHPVLMPPLGQPAPPDDVPTELRERVMRDPRAWLNAERSAFLMGAVQACRGVGYREAALVLDRLAGYLLAEHRTTDLHRLATAVRDAADAAGDVRTATWARIVLGRAAGNSGVPALRRAVTDSEQAGHRDLLAWALLGLSAYERAAGLDGVMTAPLDAARRAADLFAELGDLVGRTQALRAAALAQLLLGRGREAEASAAEGVRLARELGDPMHLANLLSTHASVLLTVHDPVRARRAASAALRLLRRAMAEQATCYVLGQLGRINAALGDRAQAQRHLTEARAIALVLDDHVQATLLLRDLAASWVGDGRADEAIRVLRRCVRVLIDLGERRRAAVTERVLAAAYSAHGDPVAAAAASAHAEAGARPRDPCGGAPQPPRLLLTR